MSSSGSSNKLKNLAQRKGLHGLTLPEILVAAAIAAFVFSLISRVIVTQVGATRRLDTGQRYREMSNRINYLLAVEGSESSDVDLTTTVASSSVPAACTGVQAVGNVLFKLSIPKATGEYGSSLNVSNVFYYNGSNGDLMRCGPLAQQNGALDHDLSQTSGSPVASVVSRSATVTVLGAGSNASTCQGESSSDRQIAYQLNFTGAAYVPPCAVVRAKTIFVCNPLTDILARFTGSISAGTASLTVGSISSGSVTAGQSLIGSNIVAGTLIISGSGSSFTLNKIQPVGTSSGSLATSRDRGSFTGSISGTTLTVAGSVTGVVSIGQELFGTGVISDTFITDFGTGTGGAGTYTISNSHGVVSSGAMTSSASRIGDC
jgi:hypothetical protein